MKQTIEALIRITGIHEASAYYTHVSTNWISIVHMLGQHAQFNEHQSGPSDTDNKALSINTAGAGL